MTVLENILQEIAGLDEQKQIAIRHNTGPAVVIAGAGTGKTKTITSRIAFLVAQGLARPEEILALTFTEKACFEMQDRVDNMLGFQYQVNNIYTFNSFGQYLINRFNLEMGLGNQIRHLDTKNIIRIYYDLLQKQNFKSFSGLSVSKYHSRNLAISLEKFFSIFKTHNLQFPGDLDEILAFQLSNIEATPERIEAEKYLQVMKDDLIQIYRSYLALCRENDWIDYNDQLLLPLQLLSTRADIKNQLNRQFRYILVDEYQDTNRIQIELIRLLAGEQNNVFVVGDDDQSIYGFRGADYRNFEEFYRIFPESATYSLTKNYRNAQNILDISYRLITHNPNRLESLKQIDKKLIAMNTPKASDNVIFETLYDIFGESDFIAREILTILDNDPQARIAILSYSILNFDPILNALDSYGINYFYDKQIRLFQTIEAQAIMALVKALFNPSANHLYNLLCSEMIGFQANELVLLNKLSGVLNTTIYQLLISSSAEIVEYLDLASAQNGITAEDKNLITELMQSSKYINIQKLFSRKLNLNIKASILLYEILKEDLGILSPESWVESGLSETQIDQRYNCLANISAFLQSIDNNTNVQESIYDLENFYQDLISRDLVEDSEIISQDISEEQVVITTIHQVKGLEFDYVFLPELIKTKMPGRVQPNKANSLLAIGEYITAKLALDTSELNIIEKRRLLYVAITRARQRVYLLASAKTAGAGRNNNPSIFLSEMNLITDGNELKYQKIEKSTQESPKIISGLMGLEKFKQDPSIISSVSSNFLIYGNYEKPIVSLTPKQIDDFSALNDDQESWTNFINKHILKFNFAEKNSFALIYGNLVHDYIYRYCEEFRLSGSPPSKEFDDIYLDKIKLLKQQLGYDDESFRVSSLQNVITKIREHYSSLSSLPTTNEQPFQYLIEDLGVRITGRIDAAKIDQDSIHIIDYKTSLIHNNTPKELEKLIKKGKINYKDSIQADVYGYVLSKQYNLPVIDTGYYIVDLDYWVIKPYLGDDLILEKIFKLANHIRSLVEK